MIDKFMQYLSDGEIVEEVIAANGKDTYLMPARRNAGHVSIAVIREIVAPRCSAMPKRRSRTLKTEMVCAAYGQRRANSSSASADGDCWCYGRGT